MLKPALSLLSGAVGRGSPASKALALGRTLIKSRKEAVLALSAAAAVTAAMVFAQGPLWQLCALWAAAELLFQGWMRYR